MHPLFLKEKCLSAFLFFLFLFTFPHSFYSCYRIFDSWDRSDFKKEAIITQRLVALFSIFHCLTKLVLQSSEVIWEITHTSFANYPSRRRKKKRKYVFHLQKLKLAWDHKHGNIIVKNLPHKYRKIQHWVEILTEQVFNFKRLQFLKCSITYQLAVSVV